MQTGDGAPDLREIAERYGRMNDTALMDEARAYDDLVDEVKPLLRAEFARRGLEPPVIEQKPEPEMRRLVTVERFLNLTEASLAQGLLESAGIESFLRDINIVRNDWFYSNAVGGIRLEVDEKDLGEAREILSQPIPESIAAEDWDEGEAGSKPVG